jgi:hypothetical protein
MHRPPATTITQQPPKPARFCAPTLSLQNLLCARHDSLQTFGTNIWVKPAYPDLDNNRFWVELFGRHLRTKSHLLSTSRRWIRFLSSSVSCASGGVETTIPLTVLTKLSQTCLRMLHAGCSGLGLRCTTLPILSFAGPTRPLHFSGRDG